MSCPYCLAFHRDDGPGPGQQARRTLVRAYWEFEEGRKNWLGFSPAVSGLLEAAYQNWMDDPAMREAIGNLQHGDFLYNVDYGWMVRHRRPEIYQQIRRVGVTQAEIAHGATGTNGADGSKGAIDKKAAGKSDKNGKKDEVGQEPQDTDRKVSEEDWLGTVEAQVWRDFREEILELRRTIEELKREGAAAEELRERSTEQYRAETEALRKGLETEQRLVEKLRHELEQEQAAATALASRLSDGILPGRLVRLLATEPRDSGIQEEPALRGLACGDLGRVCALAGRHAAVDFPGHARVWLPVSTLSVARDAELLLRPGSRVSWVAAACEGRREPGVVCEPRQDMQVLVLSASEGMRRSLAVRELALESGQPPAERPLEPGDLVCSRGALGSAEDSAMGSPPAGTGVVLRRDPECLWVRFRRLPRTAAAGNGFWEDSTQGEEEEHVDFPVSLEAAQASVVSADGTAGRTHGAGLLCRDLAAELARPGAAVRLAASSGSQSGEVGVVYALHGDGTAVVDFLSNMGFHCDVACLEVVEPPTTLQHAILCFLSECLSWQELLAQHTEELN